MKAKEYCSSNTPVAGHRWFQKLVSTNSGSSYWAQSTNRLVYDGWNLMAARTYCSQGKQVTMRPDGQYYGNSK